VRAGVAAHLQQRVVRVVRRQLPLVLQEGRFGKFQTYASGPGSPAASGTDKLSRVAGIASQLDRKSGFAVAHSKVPSSTGEQEVEI